MRVIREGNRLSILKVCNDNPKEACAGSKLKHPLSLH